MALDRDRRRNPRRENDADPGLDRDDLFLLLESYRNTIELNTTLLERQESLNAGLERILTELVSLCGSTAGIAADIGKIPGSVRDICDALCTATTGRVDTIEKTIHANRREEVDEHNRHTLRIYAAFGVLAAIVLALVGLMVKIWPTT
jgi:hypothetical protein